MCAEWPANHNPQGQQHRGRDLDDWTTRLLREVPVSGRTLHLHSQLRAATEESESELQSEGFLQMGKTSKRKLNLLY